MALYTLFRNCPNATPEFIQENMDGNLCRCTGYRPILDAAKSLCCKEGDEGTAIETGGGGGGCCGGKGKAGGCCMDKVQDESCKEGEVVNRKTSDGIDMSCHKRYATSEPIFPPQLSMLEPYRPLWLTNSEVGVDWVTPNSLSTLLALKTVHPYAKLIVGNTEVGIETRFKGLKYAMLINPKAIPELRLLEVKDSEEGNPGAEELVVGGAVTLKQLEEFCVEYEASQLKGGNWKTRGVSAVKNMLRWFASNQIRSGASLAGNLATASPISDMNPLLATLDATLKLTSLEHGSRMVNVKDFFLSYRKVNTHAVKNFFCFFVLFLSL